MCDPPMGTGKSFITFKWIEDNPDVHFVWLRPSEIIVDAFEIVDEARECES